MSKFFQVLTQLTGWT